MHLHQVKNRPLKALQGIGVVLGLFAAILADSFLTSLLIPLTGELPAAIVFWGVGIGVALWTMRRFILTYSYGMSSNMLRITFAYGRYERVMADVYFNSIRAAGTLEDLRKRYPDAKINRATRPGCDIEPLAIASHDGERVVIYLLQPDETIRETLKETAKKNKK